MSTTTDSSKSKIKPVKSAKSAKSKQKKNTKIEEDFLFENVDSDSDNIFNDVDEIENDGYDEKKNTIINLGEANNANESSDDSNIDEIDEIEEIEDDELESADDLSDSDKEYEQECLYTHVENIDHGEEVSTNNTNDVAFDENPLSKVTHNFEYVQSSMRITKPRLFNYERVRLLGDRIKQLSLGAKPMIKNIGNLDPSKVAKLELQYNVLPIMISRTLPNNKKELWKISELKH
jgi:DNA-directed RNA polymerase subunit K/omega